MNQQPNSNPDVGALEDWESRIMDFEERLRPIARRPVDITRPGWLDRLRAGVPPLDEAGVESAAAQAKERYSANIRRIADQVSSPPLA